MVVAPLDEAEALLRRTPGLPVKPIGFVVGDPCDEVVELADAVERSPDAELVWQLDEPPGFGLPSVSSQTWRESEDVTWFGNTLNMALRIDHKREVITVAAKDGNQQVLLEALASIALPMVAQHEGALVIHGSVARLGDAAVLRLQQGADQRDDVEAELVLGQGQAALFERA